LRNGCFDALGLLDVDVKRCCMARTRALARILAPVAAEHVLQQTLTHRRPPAMRISLISSTLNTSGGESRAAGNTGGDPR